LISAYYEEHDMDRVNPTTKQKLTDKGTENRVEGTIDEVTGRARQAAGGVTGDDSEQIKGKFEELKGKAKQAVGKGQQKLGEERR